MAEPVRLLAAGSLSRAIGAPDPVAGPVADPVAGRPVEAVFGASGLLRAAIEGGEPWDLFASADTGHPARLHRAALATEPRVFCRNRLCLIVREGVAGDDAAALLRRPDLRLAISTPGNDPSGDYALEALGRLDAVAPGEGRAAAARALRLTGAPGLPAPPAGRNTYGWLLGSGAADLFLTYRTNAVAAGEDTPGLRVLDLPPALAVRATYALTTRTGAGPAAQALADRLMAPDFQTRLAAFGFEPAREHKSEGHPA